MFEYYDWYDDVYGTCEPSYDNDTERIQFILDNIPERGAKILDIGCHDGHITSMFRKHGNDVHAIDISMMAVKRAREKGIKAIQGDFLNKAIGEGNFDIVVAGECLEHSFNTTEFLNKVKVLLRPGGKLIVTTPNICSIARRIAHLFGRYAYFEYCEDSGNAGHIRFYRFSDIEKQLSMVGFRVIKSESDHINLGLFTSKFLTKWFKHFGRSILVVAEAV